MSSPRQTPVLGAGDRNDMVIRHIYELADPTASRPVRASGLLLSGRGRTRRSSMKRVVWSLIRAAIVLQVVLLGLALVLGWLRADNPDMRQTSLNRPHSINRSL